MIVDPFGHPNEDSIYVDGSEYSNYSFFNAIKVINQPSAFEVHFYDVLPSGIDGSNGIARSQIAEGNNIMFFHDANLFLKGQIEKISYDSDGNVIANGKGMETLLLRRITGRREYASTGTNVIIAELASSGLNGAAPWIVDTGLNPNFGNYVTRTEGDNRLSPIQSLSNEADFEWRIRQSGATYGADIIDIGSQLGSSTTQRTFYTGGADQNAFKLDKEQNNELLVNRVVVFGYGDGVNQISGLASDSTSITDNGIYEKAFYDPLVTNSGFAGSMANRILLDIANTPHYPRIEIRDIDFNIGIGDVVTVIDSGTNILGSTYRISQLERSFSFQDGEKLIVGITNT